VLYDPKENRLQEESFNLFPGRRGKWGEAWQGRAIQEYLAREIQGQKEWTPFHEGNDK